MKNSNIFPRCGPRVARWAALLLVAGIGAFVCAGCPLPEDPNSYSYTVTFYKNDGTGAVVEVKTVDSPATTVDSLPAEPQRPGYVFAGWNTTSEGGGIPFTVDTPVKANIAVYAQWGVGYSYTVTFDSNGGTTAAVPGIKTVDSPATTVDALPAIPGKTGSVFTGWNTAADGSGSAFDVATTVTASLAVYAQWRVPFSYTVSFNKNGGDTEASPTAKTVTEPATTVDALPVAPGKTGHAFAGWNTTADGSGSAFDAATAVSADITVYARWVTNYSYTVTFNNNGGTVAANPATKTVNAPATTVDTLPTQPGRTGFVFTGWNTKADGSGNPFDGATVVSASIAVYAQWVMDYAYTVTFNSNGGTTAANPASKQVKAPATTVGTLPATPGRTGYVFVGWNTKADGTGGPFYAETVVSASIEVYAQWRAPYSYTVTFNNNGGTTPANPSSKIVNEPATTVATLPDAPKKTGYIFNGWNTNPAGIYGIPFTASTPVSADITVYAQWQSYSYTVTFNMNGGDTPANPASKPVNSPAVNVGTLPAPPTKSGSMFAGWNTAADGPGLVFDASTVVTGNQTVYARWSTGAPGDVGIVLRFDDPGAGAWDQAAVGDTFTIKQGGASASRTITLEAGWTSPDWRVDGKSQGAGNAFTLNAGDYAVGGHTLQVTAYQGGVPWSKTVPFTVTAGVSGLSLNKTTLTLAPGRSETLLPIVTPANAADKSVTWSVTPTGIASVSETGLVTALSAGTATVRATSVDNSAATADCTVTVAAAQGIVLRFDDPGAGAWDSDVVGETFTLYQNGIAPEEPPSKTIALSGGPWTSQEWRVDGGSAGAGSSVTLNAVDYAVGGHTLQVTASDGSGVPWSKTLPFTVIATVTNVALNKTALSLAPGQSETLLPRVTPANAADRSVTWSVISASPAGAVSVSSAGLVSAVSIGAATIRASSNDTPTAYAECTVTVGAAQGITLRFIDPGLDAWDSGVVGDSFTISQSGAGKTITLVGTWDASPEPVWRVDGRPQGGASATVVINGVNYAVGGHTLQVTAYQGGIPWSKTVAFTVTN